MRAAFAIALISLGVGVGIGWVLGTGRRAVVTEVAPSAQAPAALAPAKREEPDLRGPGARSPLDSPQPEAFAGPTQASSEPAPGAEPPAREPVEDLAGLSAAELSRLEQELSTQLDALTRDEFEGRLRNGLGELLSTNGTISDENGTWDPDVLMVLRAHPDGTWWKVVLPREEYPDAYALFDRRKAVRTALGSD